ncbi:hypothetical protein [Curtobacterium flaccumfaciens]|uniref:hypothetical protein n=1 Tax=Curtobacterium flaccumfaciens TaxID=2035 RepID=UPI003CEA3211
MHEQEQLVPLDRQGGSGQGHDDISPRRGVVKRSVALLLTEPEPRVDALDEDGCRREHVPGDALPGVEGPRTERLVDLGRDGDGVLHPIEQKRHALPLLPLPGLFEWQDLPAQEFRHEELRVVARAVELGRELLEEDSAVDLRPSDEPLAEFRDDVAAPDATARSEDRVELAEPSVDEDGARRTDCLGSPVRRDDLRGEPELKVLLALPVEVTLARVEDRTEFLDRNVGRTVLPTEVGHAPFTATWLLHEARVHHR